MYIYMCVCVCIILLACPDALDGPPQGIVSLVNSATLQPRAPDRIEQLRSARAHQDLNSR